MKNVKTSLKPIPLSMRGKKRYVSFELLSDKKLGEKEVFQAVKQSLLQLYGEIGVACQRPWLISFKGNKGVLRCALSEVEEVKAGLLFLEKVGQTPVSPKILRVSGSSLTATPPGQRTRLISLSETCGRSAVAEDPTPGTATKLTRLSAYGNRWPSNESIDTLPNSPSD